MGHINITVGFKGDRWVKTRALVDTGATYRLLPRGLAYRAGLDAARRTYRVRLANGKSLKVDGDIGAVRIDGRQAPATILIGEADEPIVGVETLEALGVRLDMKRGTIHPTRKYAVRLGGYR